MDVEGAYTVTYTKTGGSCATENPDWVQGVLLVTQNGSALEFDFGDPYVLSGTVDASGIYEFQGALTDAEGLVSAQGRGTFTSTAIESADGNTSATAGIAAQYDNGGACATYGTYSGNKFATTAFAFAP